MQKRVGEQTVQFEKKVSFMATASVVGQKEAQGPLSEHFDIIMENAEWGEDTWEKAESKMQKEALIRAVEKAQIDIKDINYLFAGDLLNQCISSTFGLIDFGVPYLGVYGACSTMAETVGLSAMTIDGGFANITAAVTSSHFCTAERQYRNPLAYGGQRTPTAQWTVTGAGAAILEDGGDGPFVTHFTSGKIVDFGVTDANNMGAAMAPAAADTLCAHFRDTGRSPEFYDLILSGDLGVVGKAALIDLMYEKGYMISKNYDDCGCMIFDVEKQDMHAGGSGCGCLASTFCGYIMDMIKSGEVKNVLFMGTGALLSPTSTLQGASIPSVAHAVAVSTEL